MRKSHVATTLVAVTACLTAATALHRRPGRHLPATTLPSDSAVADPGGVVLPFVRPVAGAPDVAAPVSAEPAPEQPAAPARCGDSGGRTKAGASCGARATAGGRCHHHRLAA